MTALLSGNSVREQRSVCETAALAIADSSAQQLGWPGPVGEAGEAEVLLLKPTVAIETFPAV